MHILNHIVTSGSREKPILLDVFYEKNNQPKPVIIFVHGFKGFKDWGQFNKLGSHFAEAGFILLKFNFSYNGTSPENPTAFVDLEAFGHNNFSTEFDDLGIMIDWITEKQNFIAPSEIDTNAIYLAGHSRGGSICICKAAEDDRIKKLVTWAAPNALDHNWTPETLAQWKATGVKHIKNARTNQEMPLYYQMVEDFQANADRFNIQKAVASLKIPQLIIHGKADSSVPVAQAIEMKSWNPNATLFLLDACGHTFGGVHPWIKKEVAQHSLDAVDASIQFLKQ